jgi:hypothetical protein
MLNGRVLASLPGPGVAAPHGDILPLIETLENRWMRAWTGGDKR